MKEAQHVKFIKQGNTAVEAEFCWAYKAQPTAPIKIWYKKGHNMKYVWPFLYYDDRKPRSTR